MPQRLTFNRQTFFGPRHSEAIVLRISTIFVLLGVLVVSPVAAQEKLGSKSSSVPPLEAVDRLGQLGPPSPLKGASAQDRTIAKLIARLMPRNHVSSQELNDEISKRALKLFIGSLDPLKLYFVQSDIDEFERSSTLIDDMVRKGNLSLAFKVFARFVQRVDERISDAMKMLDGEFEFESNETIILDPENVQYAANAKQAQDRWRRQIKYALLDLKDDDKDGDEARQLLKRRYSRYARRWKQTDSEDLVEMFLTAVTMSYDPHSTYMAPGTLEDFEISMRLNLDGIGAQLREKDGNTVITRIIPGGAAAKQGELKPDDVIVNVGQADGNERVDIVEMPLSDVVKLIRGKAGTRVELGVKKGGLGDVETIEIVRARIELEESAARGKIIEHTGPSGDTLLKMGYINLPSFYLDMDGARNDRQNFRSSTRDVRRILEDFKAQGVDGVVLDLSKNGGGSLTEAINLTGLFIDRGPVVQVKNSDGSVHKYSDDVQGTSWDGPLVVQTSKFSASASEILAGAIRDYHRGIIVGDPQTHGKGTVQTLMDLGQTLFRTSRNKFGALKVTLQQFYLPDGQSTQLDGVPADVVLPSITAKMDVGEGDLKYALKHDKVKTAKHMLYNMVPTDLVNALRARSMERVTKDKEFVDLLRRIELYVNQKEKNEVSLNEIDFMARRQELDAQKEEEEEVLEAELNGEEVYHDSFYNREVLNIASEYIEGLRKQNLAKAS